MKHRSQPQYYSTTEAVAFVGVSYSTLRRWIRKGYLPAPRKCSDGRRGVWLAWRYNVLRRARRLAKLSRAGLPLDQA